MATSSPKRRRRWCQFGLRTLLIGVLVLSLPLSWVACRKQRAKKQRQAREAIERTEGRAPLDFKSNALIHVSYLPNWVRALFGDDFFFDVTVVWGYETFGDAGLEHLDGLANVEKLYLRGTQVTDAGLAHVEGLKNLAYLDLQGRHITDAGLEHLSGLTNLGYLNLWNTQITDAGLEHLEGLTSLQSLFLSRTQVTDAGLEHLRGLTNLRYLQVWHTDVTDEGVKRLHEALPNCEIVYKVSWWS